MWAAVSGYLCFQCSMCVHPCLESCSQVILLLCKEMTGVYSTPPPPPQDPLGLTKKETKGLSPVAKSPVFCATLCPSSTYKESQS